MTVDDLTTAQVASRPVTYDSSGLSAEAIHERPCIESPCTKAKDLAKLAQTSNVVFDPGSYSVTPPSESPVEEPFLAPQSDPAMTRYVIDMLNNDGRRVIATPSGPDGADDGFTVADGAMAPPPPV
jgi:hypothetical protein